MRHLSIKDTAHHPSHWLRGGGEERIIHLLSTKRSNRNVDFKTAIVLDLCRSYATSGKNIFYKILIRQALKKA